MSSERALDNANCVSEGVCHKDLKTFLLQNLPPGAVLGVADPKLAASITEESEVKCITGGIVPEIMRGIRLHYIKLNNISN